MADFRVLGAEAEVAKCKHNLTIAEQNLANAKKLAELDAADYAAVCARTTARVAQAEQRVKDATDAATAAEALLAQAKETVAKQNAAT